MTKRHAAWSPLALVSGTTLRFALLATAVVATSTQLYLLMFRLVPAHRAGQDEAAQRCGAIYRNDIEGLDRSLTPRAFTNDDAMAQLTDAQATWFGCLAPTYRTAGLWVLGGLTALVAAAAIYLFVTPWWERRRRRLVPVESRRLAENLARLVTVAGLRKPPDFVLERGTNARDAVTFGRSGSYVVALGAGLIPLLRSNPAVFRAIVLHELAHIRNRDVDVGYATIAIWRAFLAVAVLPFIVLVVLSPVFSTGAIPPVDLLRVSCFIAIVLLVRTAVFRIREFYADARAASWPGVRDGLLTAVDLATPQRTHPSSEQRKAVIRDDRNLLRPGFWEMVAVGSTGMLIAHTAAGYLALFTRPWTAYGVLGVVAATAFAGALAAVVWRNALLAAEHPGGSVVPPLASKGRVLRPALGLAVGVLVGEPLAVGGSFWGVLGAGTEISGAVRAVPVLSGPPYLHPEEEWEATPARPAVMVR